jgi:hypothetical protein
MKGQNRRFQTRDNQFSGARHRVSACALRTAKRLQFCVEFAEISCARRATATSSQRNEQFRASNQSRTRVPCDLRWRGISLGPRSECFPAIAPACPQGCEPRRAQLRSDHDRLRQLRSCRLCSVSQRTCASGPLFQNSGVDSAVGRIAVSWRAHFRARAARARLARSCSRRPVGDATRG